MSTATTVSNAVNNFVAAAKTDVAAAEKALVADVQKLSGVLTLVKAHPFTFGAVAIVCAAVGHFV